MLKIHLDENVSTAIAEALRQRGMDVTVPTDVNLLEAADEEHLEYALNAGRLVITHDRDFLALAARGVPHAGIAYCHQDDQTIGQIVRRIVQLEEETQPGDMVGKVEFL